jgi:hypothetical protein
MLEQGWMRDNRIPHEPNRAGEPTAAIQFGVVPMGMACFGGAASGLGGVGL